jgi:hypothetical protein
MNQGPITIAERDRLAYLADCAMAAGYWWGVGVGLLIAWAWPRAWRMSVCAVALWAIPMLLSRHYRRRAYFDTASRLAADDRPTVFHD